MDQMILPKPSIIIIWTYQDMMDWISRILVGEMVGADEDFGLELGSWAIRAQFLIKPKPLFALGKILMDQMILPKPSILIIWTYQDMMEWMSRILAGRFDWH
jgi:hypothetical protein